MSNSSERLSIGTALSDVVFEGRDETKLLSDYEYKEKWKKYLLQYNGYPIELQVEHLTDRRIKLIAEAVKETSAQVVGIHQATIKQDPIKNPEKCWHKTKLGMDLAQQLGVEYFVFHLTIQDDNKDRDAQRKQAIIFFEQINDYHSFQKHTYSLALENLEYPKHPASNNEILDIMQELVEIHPNLGFIFDLAHYWHNRLSLLPDAKITEEDFYEELKKILTDFITKSTYALMGFHIGQAYINGEDHQTHELPGNLKGTYREDNDFSKPEEFSGEWLDVKRALFIIAEVCHQNQIPLASLLYILEVHEREAWEIIDITEQLNYD